MNITEDNQKVEGYSKKTRVFLFCVLLVIILGISGYSYLNSRGIDFKNISMEEIVSEFLFRDKANAQKPLVIEYAVQEHPVFDVYNGQIIKCTDEGITALDKEGKEEWKITVALNKPLIKKAGQYLLIADIGGRNIIVINKSNVKWKTQTDNSIINGDISPDGYVSVVQELPGYKARISVFDPYGGEIFYRSIAENFILSAQVSPEGEQVLINSIDTSGTNAASAFEYLDMMGSPFSVNMPKENKIFPFVWYFKNNSHLAVNDSMIVFFDKDRNRKWEKEFDKILSSEILEDKYVAVASVLNKQLSFNSGKADLQIFDTDGNKISEYIVDDEIKNISAYSDILAINTGREAFFINSRGKLLGQFSSRADISQVCFFNKIEAALITKTNISIIKVQ